MEALDEACKKLFLQANNSRIDGLIPNYEKARSVLEGFDVRKLGEKLAVLALCEIINHVEFPSLIMRKSCVGRAEEKLTEFFNVDPDHEFHMAEVEEIEREIWNGKEISQIFPYKK